MVTNTYAKVNDMEYKLTAKMLFLLICYLPLVDMFLPKIDFGAGLPNFDAFRLILFGFIMLFMVETAIQKRIKGFDNPWFLIVCLYVFIVVVSPLWSIEYSYNTTLIQELFFAVISPLFILMVALSLFNRIELVEQYMRHLIFVAVVLSIISIIQIILGVSEIHGQARAAGTMANPNRLAIFLVFSIPCILYSAEKKIIINRKICVIILSLVVLGVLSTVSKKGAATMLVSFFLYFLLKRQYQKIVIILVITFVTGFLLSGYAFFSDRFSLDVVTHELEGKWNMTLAGVDMFAEKPVLGHGYKGYYENFSQYFPHAFVKKYDAHNEFVTALANYGLIGMVLFLGIFLYPLNYARKIIRKSKYQDVSEVKIDMAVIGISTIIPFMISAFYAGTLFNQTTAVFAFYAQTSFVFVGDE